MQNVGLKLGLASLFFLIALAFVYRSFYGMRITDESSRLFSLSPENKVIVSGAPFLLIKNGGWKGGTEKPSTIIILKGFRLPLHLSNYETPPNAAFSISASIRRKKEVLLFDRLLFHPHRYLSAFLRVASVPG